MNERAIFIEALDRDTPADRAAYLDEACAGDPALRERVEALLRSHEEAGEFPGKLTPQRLAEGFAARESDDTRAAPAADGDAGLEFLEPSDKPGSIGRLSHYEVREVVGRGGMGVVLRAFDERLHRVVAIKVMASQLATSATARRRFTREARAAAAVTHDHVVTIHAVEDAGPLPYIVMQYVAGVSLQDRLDRTGPLHVNEVLRIGTQTATGLAAAHAQGLVHRDVKPANILLENGVERVKLTDFGLARAADDASLTQSGVVAGTPSFMSPEQAEGRPVDHRSDLFSLGSVLYAMCTGRPPFRAGSSMGVLKRVCEGTPAPIREANPEVPDWLVAVVEKLHAKDPAARFQSAAEVAELLGRHLAQVQHPAVVRLPAAAEPAGRLPVSDRAARRNRWAVTAAVLVAVLAVLGAAEATGVTNVRATAIRLFTPDGTLVVETDDPAVKVTVEGDGDLVITGTGAQEVRLRAGSYKVQAVKDGKPVKLDRDLVTISRGDRQIVRVRLEGAAPAAVVPPAERGAFVLLGGTGVAERKFETLAEAVRAASDGDIIEVRGNGPFVTESLRIPTALTIRAGHGFRPVIRLSPEVLHGGTALVAEAALVLEGLELQRETRPLKEGEPEQFVLAANRGLYAANCRFLMRRVGLHPRGWVSPCELRNCEVLCSEGDGPIHLRHLQPGRQLDLENCLVAGLKSWQVEYLPMDEEGRVRLRRNTFLATLGHVHLLFSPETVLELKHPNDAAGVMRVEASENLFHAGAVLAAGSTAGDKQHPPADLLPLLGRRCEWKGERNVYAVDGSFARASLSLDKDWEPLAEMKGLADWRRFWKTDEVGSVEGQIRYEGGDLLARLAAEPEMLTPEDFRLRPDSAGHEAGKDGKDLGADVDLVGPGAAYEKWKKTPDYQEWLKETGQLRPDPPKPEPGAFVRLGGKGVAERKFDTLAEAVRFTSDGDTIEVRGNGPFVTKPVEIGKKGLTIRAAAGYRPVLTGHPGQIGDLESCLLRTQGPLILEGLELRMRGSDLSAIVHSSQAPLHVASCRFVLNGSNSIRADTGCTVRNCEFAGLANHHHVFWRLSSNGSVVLENNVFGCGTAALGLEWGPRDLHDVAVRLRHNTAVTDFSIIHGLEVVPESAGPDSAPGRQPVRMHVSANVFDPISPTGGRTLSVLLPPNWYDKGTKPLSPEEAERLLPRLMAWREERNLYRKNMSFQTVRQVKDASGPERVETDEVLPAGRTLADWQRLWKARDSGSAEGVIRYEGRDRFPFMRSTPERITPADFRLRPDSAGYRAGKDKKDLGADVDLVGPGAAYERWKKTPEYQQWLKDTGQLGGGG